MSINSCNGNMPSLQGVREVVFSLKRYMFECKSRGFSSSVALAKIKRKLKAELVKCYSCACFNSGENPEKRAKKTLDGFLNELAEIKRKCLKDASASVACDPSAECESIVIAAFPGFFAIMTYRMAHFFYTEKTPLLPRLMTEVAHSLTGIDINAGAKIGENFFIDHGTGVVIGETAEIGNDCRLYQGVTLGALSIKKEERNNDKRHPTLGNNVTVYANATILGGKTVIGDGCVIGGNAFIVKSVPAGCKIVSRPTVIDE